MKLSITFSSAAYPLEAYSRSLEQAGFLIEMIREPKALASAIEADPGAARWARLPLFLHLRAVRTA
ncbi:MAG: hypothetical protein ABJB55_03065 [Actinomycetota bacterium]